MCFDSLYVAKEIHTWERGNFLELNFSIDFIKYLN